MNHKTALTSIVLMLLLTVVMIINVEPVNAESNVDLLSDTGYISNSGSYYIVGEVQNTGDTSVRFVKITATYYDSSNNEIATEYGYANLNTLAPNAKSAYTIALLSDADLEHIDHYTLDAGYSDTSTPEQALSILSHSNYISSIGSLHVTGEIKNTGDSTSIYTTIYATFYDSDGKVVGTEYTFPDPDDIETGTTSPFDLLYNVYDRVPMIESYRLTAESDQYGVVAEVIGTVTTTPTATPDATETPSTEPSPTPTVPEFPIAAALIALLIGTFCSMLFLKRVNFGKSSNRQNRFSFLFRVT